AVVVVDGAAGGPPSGPRTPGERDLERGAGAGARAGAGRALLLAAAQGAGMSAGRERDRAAEDSTRSRPQLAPATGTRPLADGPLATRGAQPRLSTRGPRRRGALGAGLRRVPTAAWICALVAIA